MLVGAADDPLLVCGVQVVDLYGEPAADVVEEYLGHLGPDLRIVPWRCPNPPAATVREALPWLGELLELLPKLRVVVLCGRTAQRATSYLYRHHPALCVLHAPHPSTRGLGTPERHEYFWAAMRKAAAQMGGEH